MCVISKLEYNSIAHVHVHLKVYQCTKRYLGFF